MYMLFLVRILVVSALKAPGTRPTLGRASGITLKQDDGTILKQDAVCDDAQSVLPELEEAPMMRPPQRSATRPGYVPNPELVTWAPFSYAEPRARREASRDFVREELSQLPALPPLRVVLMGGVAAGKGTLAPMLSQAFRVRCIGVGALLRGETRAGKQRGIVASSAMAAGQLLPDELVLQLLMERLGGNTDAAQNGWLLDGFPRTEAQATALVHADDWTDLRPDAVILIERPDELVREFALGRCSDSATGQTYHPVYAPPPPDVHERLVWRVDDTSDALNRRIAEHRRSVDGIMRVFEGADIPTRRFDNARSEISTFSEVAAFLKRVALLKLVAARRELGSEFSLREVAEALQPSSDDEVDVALYCLLDESEQACLARFQEERERTLTPDDVDVYCDPYEDEGACPHAHTLPALSTASVHTLLTVASHAHVHCVSACGAGACVLRYQTELRVGALLAAVQRCNTYELGEVTPLLIGEEQVGWLNPSARECTAVSRPRELLWPCSRLRLYLCVVRVWCSRLSLCVQLRSQEATTPHISHTPRTSSHLLEPRTRVSLCSRRPHCPARRWPSVRARRVGAAERRRCRHRRCERERLCSAHRPRW
jgi:adenylate kinase